MKKPERIFNFDSGWSTDLEKVFYIGMPKIVDCKLFLEIGAFDPDLKNKECYFTHEEFILPASDDFKKCVVENMTPSNSFESEVERGVKKFYPKAEGSELTFARKTVEELVYGNLVDLHDTVSFYDFKYNCEKFRKAHAQWIKYKESLRPVLPISEEVQDKCFSPDQGKKYMLNMNKIKEHNFLKGHLMSIESYYSNVELSNSKCEQLFSLYGIPESCFDEIKGE